jgi:hypothetical protein
MSGPIDYAALRVQLELRLRALRSGQGSASAEDVALAEQAVDVGTQDLITRAATAFGLLGAAPTSAPAGEPEPEE